MNQTLRLTLVAVCAGLSCSAYAAPVSVASYDTFNGDSGQFHYWDKNYTGVGSTTTDHAPLTGGTGDLTDGVIAPANWFAVENAAGTGPYVGYFNFDPTITFHFAAPTSFSSATFYFDVAKAGGVNQPRSIDVNALSFTLPTYPGTAPQSFTANLSLLAPTNTLAVTFHRSDFWVFVSEARFTTADATSTGVPEPSSPALLLAGLAGLGVLAKRRKS